MSRVSFACDLRLAAVAVAVAVAACSGTAPAPDPAPALIPAAERRAPEPDAEEFPEVWYEPSEPFTIVGPIHYVGTKALSAFLITTSRGHLLIVGGMPESGPDIVASIRALGHDPADVRVLLTTHAHVDHVGVLAHLARVTGAEVAAMEADRALLESGGRTDYLYADSPAFRFEPVTVDRVLQDGDQVALGEVTLTARLTPGHTRGNTTWITEVEDGGRRYRVVFPGALSVNPGTRLVREPSYPGILEDYRRSVALLESLEPDIFLAGHGPQYDCDGKRARMAGEGVAAWVDPEGYRELVARGQAAIETAAAEE